MMKVLGMLAFIWVNIGLPLTVPRPVWSVFSVDVLITIFATIAAWNTLAGGWGDLAVLAPLDWPYGGLPFLSGLGAHSLRGD